MKYLIVTIFMLVLSSWVDANDKKVDSVSEPDQKLYLYRDLGIILFSSKFKNSDLYWMSFLSGGHADWTYYIQLEKSEFFDVWNQKVEIKELYKKYSSVRMYADESLKIEKAYDLKSAKSKHVLPKAMEQMFFKSEVPIKELTNQASGAPKSGAPS